MEQLCVLKQVYYQLLEKLSSRQFQMKLVSVMNKTNDKKYNISLQLIEMLSTTIEMSLINGNVRRSLHYCVMLDHEIERLQKLVQDDFNHYIAGRLLQ